MKFDVNNLSRENRGLIYKQKLKIKNNDFKFKNILN